MDLELDDKVVLITGGSDGLGRAAAARLVAEGARVAICARDEQRLESTAAELEAIGADSGGEVLAMPADVTDPAALEGFLGAAVERWGRVDGLVNNAGETSAMRFESLTDEALDRDLELKVYAAVRLIRLALPLLRRSPGPSVVNVLSIGAKAPTPRSTPTTISRAAGLALTKVLASELGPEGVRVNAICVGLVESGQWVRLAEERGMAIDDLQAALVEDAGVPLGRVGRGDEFGDLAAYLLSARSSYVTGTAINLDGGTSPVV
jgi:NAD(P)-dependent dehydrogenase (short-subunit alcohol dehydrogenase family)